MARCGLVDLFTYEAWYKFSKEYKEQYKKENGKELETDVAIAITFGKLFKVVNKLETITKEDGTVEKKIVQKEEPTLPQIEDEVMFIKLGNANCSDDAALLKIQRYFEKEENKNVGFTGMHLDLMCDFFKDLPLITGAYKRSVEARDKYRKEIKEKYENTEAETDTQE